MTTYVALLRGVNVGAHGRVDMRELKRTFEALGCVDVSTYINSGNVIFRDRRKASTLTRLAEKELGRRVAIRSLAEMQALCDSISDRRRNDGEQRTDVAFLLDEPGEQVWHALRKDVPQGYAHDWGAEVTVRNVNTVRKLRALMEALDGR